jgi:hypothetical protein
VRSSSDDGGDDDIPSRAAILESQLPFVPKLRAGEAMGEATPRSTSASAVDPGEIGRPAAGDSFKVFTT